MTPMDAKTLEALKASIAKWERNAEAECFEDYRTRDEDCPLCVLFHLGSETSSCHGCPIFEKTELQFCENTPYHNAWLAWFSWRKVPESAERRDRAHAAARDEVAFLKSLLPEAAP